MSGCAKRLAAVLVLATWVSSTRAGDIVVRLGNPPPDGSLVFQLFDSADAFGDLRQPVRALTLPADGRAGYRIENVPAGEYALVVYHDENTNTFLDRNFIGIPREPLGFSNEYRPKGPPSYARARFELTADEVRDMEVALDRPLGKRGRIGLGVGVVAASSPYRDSDSGLLRVIPAVTYIGDRLQVFGPRANLGLIGGDDVRLAATLSYRFGAYEEDDSPALAGLGDRDDTVMAGLALQAELPGGFDVSLGYEHDALDEIGGGAAKLEIDRSFQRGIFRFSPSVGLNLLTSELASHDFGVPGDAATPGRPAYSLDETLGIEVGLGTFVEITRDWLFVMSVAVEFLDGDISDSPIVEKDYLVSGFMALNYTL